MGKLVGLVNARMYASPDETKNAISQALSLIKFQPKNSIKTIAIKPNLCYYRGPSTGETTDPRVVGGIIDYLREHYGSDLDIKVVEADATAMKTKYAFQVLGYTKLAKEKKVELLNLSKAVLEEKKSNVNGQELIFQVPRLLLKSDLFINVPKLKIMLPTTITCALKNLFGCIGYPKKIVYHPHLEEAIVGINKILRPHLTVVDGVVALGKFPVNLDLLMASEDPFSIDWIAARIMGCNPAKIKHLKIAMKSGVGNPNGIKVLGEDMEKFRKLFPRVHLLTSKIVRSIQFNLFRLYSKMVKDTVPSMLEEHAYMHA